MAPKIARVTLAQGKRIDADGQLAGTPSMVFDAVAIILSDKAACQLSGEGAAIDFFRNAFGHLKAIGVDAGGRGLLEHAGVPADAAGVVDVRDSRSFMTLAKTRQWDREASVRSLA